VHAAADGADALRVLADGMPVDLLVTDVIMPGMTGPELVERVGQERPDLSVLYMSGYPEGVLTHGGVVDPGVRLLEKPFSEQELLDAVGRALAERP
jgi:CheY-like chemotaxis protein